jgi:uncharacterized protein (DUF1330 family)
MIMILRLTAIAILLATPACAQTRVPPTAAGVTAPTSLDPKVCDHKPVIMVVQGMLKDRERLAGYAKAIRESGLYPLLGGYYMNNPRPVAVFEGDAGPSYSVLMVRFPCYAHARAFWYSKQYQDKIVPLRQNPSAGDFTVTVYAEADLPPYMAGRVQPGPYIEKPAASVAAGLPKVSD